ERDLILPDLTFLALVLLDERGTVGAGQDDVAVVARGRDRDVRGVTDVGVPRASEGHPLVADAVVADGCRGRWRQRRRGRDDRLPAWRLLIKGVGEVGVRERRRAREKLWLAGRPLLEEGA